MNKNIELGAWRGLTCKAKEKMRVEIEFRRFFSHISALLNTKSTIFKQFRVVSSSFSAVN